MKEEIEAVFADIDPEDIRARLPGIGFTCVYPETMSVTRTFHFKGEAGCKWARVRNDGQGRITMSVKEVVDYGRVDGTLETELVIDDFDRGVDFLRACGLEEVAYHEKKREYWRNRELGVDVMIDTWPGIPTYLEVEGGSEEAVRMACSALELDFDEAVFGAVDVLYERYLGIPKDVINNMRVITFACPPTGGSAA